MPRLPSLQRLVKIALVLGFFSFAAREMNQASWNAGGVTILWPTNGLLTGILLSSSKRQWPAFIGIAGLIDLAVNLSLQTHVYIGLYLSGCNMLEAAMAAALLYPYIAARPDLTQRRQLVAFLGYGVLLAPLVASFLASFALVDTPRIPTLHDFLRWFTADALGMATVAPLYLAFRQRDRLTDRSWPEIVCLFGFLAGVTFAVFWQTRFPFLFVVLPFLALLAARTGLAGSALGLLLVTIIGGLLTTFGRGPIGLVPGASDAERDLVFQFFIANSMLVLYVFEVLRAESRQLQEQIHARERRFRLLAEASNDIIILCDLYGRRTYVSPSAREILGWTPEQLLAGTYSDLVHPDDEAAVRQMFEGYRESGSPPSPGEFRYRKPDGEYMWLEFNPRPYYDDNSGAPAGFVNIARDITRRKREEEEFQRSYETVEHLASCDGLTGIANRRQFDLVLEREWLRAARDRTNLSLLLFDVDRFKAYNDVYGHLRGDEGLRNVVSVMQPLVNRAADLLARYGGEEFIAVLPNTDASGARQLAEWIREAVEERGFPHSDNPPHGVITVSVGCATMTPHPALSCIELVEAADQALYRAKSLGRNRVQQAEAFPDAGSVLLTG